MQHSGRDGPGLGVGVGVRMDVLDSMPCSIRFFFFPPTFIEKTKTTTKKSRALRDEYFSSLLIENIRAFLPTFRAEKEIRGLFGTDNFFKSYTCLLFLLKALLFGIYLSKFFYKTYFSHLKERRQPGLVRFPDATQFI